MTVGTVRDGLVERLEGRKLSNVPSQTINWIESSHACRSLPPSIQVVINCIQLHLGFVTIYCDLQTSLLLDLIGYLLALFQGSLVSVFLSLAVPAVTPVFDHLQVTVNNQTLEPGDAWEQT